MTDRIRNAALLAGVRILEFLSVDANFKLAGYGLLVLVVGSVVGLVKLFS